MTPAQLIKKYAKATHISVMAMEKQMGWAVDTIRKLQLPTEKTVARIKEIAKVYPDLYDKVPELRSIVGEDLSYKVRDARIEGLQALVEQQRQTIEALRLDIELLQKLLKGKGDQSLD